MHWFGKLNSGRPMLNSGETFSRDDGKQYLASGPADVKSCVGCAFYGIDCLQQDIPCCVDVTDAGTVAVIYLEVEHVGQ